MLHLNGFSHFDQDDFNMFCGAEQLPNNELPMIRYFDDEHTILIDGSDTPEKPYQINVVAMDHEEGSMTQVSFSVANLSAVRLITEGLINLDAKGAFDLLVALGGEVL